MRARNLQWIMASLNKPWWKSWNLKLLPVGFDLLPVTSVSTSGNITYQERYHQRVKQSCQPTQTIFLVQKSHLVFLFHPDSNFYDPDLNFTIVRLRLKTDDRNRMIVNVFEWSIEIEEFHEFQDRLFWDDRLIRIAIIDVKIVNINLNPFLYLVGVSKLDSFKTWIALHVTPIPLRTPLKQTKAPELKFVTMIINIRIWIS